MDISTVMTWTVSLCHLCIFVAPAVQRPLPNPSSWPFLLPALSLSLIFPLLTASQSLSLSCFILCSSLLLGAPHWDRGQRAPEGPMCVFMCGGQEAAEEDLSGWTGRAPSCEQGEGRRKGGVVLLWGTASPMVWQGQLLLRGTFWAHVCQRGGTVQPWGPSAVCRYTSWDGCKENFAFLVKISHLYLDSCASNIFPFSNVTYLCWFGTGIWLPEPVICLPGVFLSVIIIIILTHLKICVWCIFAISVPVLSRLFINASKLNSVESRVWPWGLLPSLNSYSFSFLWCLLKSILTVSVGHGFPLTWPENYERLVKHFCLLWL